MNIRFYKNFSKRKNSTKRPSASDNYNDRKCHLKEDTSIDNPSIVLSNREGNMSQTGNPITTSNAIASNANSCSVSFTPAQTYNGYDRPWAPGAGTNLIEPIMASYGYNDITCTNNGDGSFTLNGTATGAATFRIDQSTYNGTNNLKYYTAGQYTVSGLSGGVRLIIMQNATWSAKATFITNGTQTISADSNNCFIYLLVPNGTTVDNVTVKPQLERGSTATDWTPYANTCAINGKTSINLNVNGTTISEPFGQTVYGGVWNVISGSVRDDWDVIASYNGESLPGEWLSTMDLYSSINPPTTGAEVVYKVTTPTSFTIPGHVVPLNENANTLSANADSISINYDISTSGDLPLNYTYAYIDKFKKYYFVSAPVVLTDGTIQYDLVEDVMATNKTAIGSTVAQIAYSSTGYDTMKVDTRLAVKATKTITSNKDAAGIFNGSGCYVLGLSNVDSGTSIICYYAMNQGELNSFMNEVATDTNLKDSVKNYCTDVWDAIVSCIWIPVEISEIPGTSGVNIKVSNYTCTTTGKKISNPPNRASSVSVSIPWTYSDFRRTAPYTTLNAWLPGFGYISLNASDLVAESSIKFNYMVDCMTGDCCCRIIDGTDSDIIFQTISYNMAISIPLSRYTQDAQAFIGNTASFVGNAGTLMASIPTAMFNPGGVLASAVGTVASGAQLCLGANSRDVSIKGTLGGRAIVANGVDTAIVAFSMDTENPDDANYIAKWGRPVGVTHAISNHSGYVQCVDASVAIAGDTWERDEINSYLNGGFYYE